MYGSLSSNEVECKTKTNLVKTDDESALNRKVWDGNFNLWWFIGSFLAIFFCYVKGLPLLARKDVNPWFATHLVTVSIVSTCCIWNIFHSPSHGVIYRKIHTYVGRIAMVTGFIGVTTGIVYLWHVLFRYHVVVNAMTVGITFGGISQALAQIVGWLIIKSNYKQKVQIHMFLMIYVFFSGCLTPAFMRLDEYLGFREALHGTWNSFCWMIPFCWGVLCFFAIRRKRLI